MNRYRPPHPESWSGRADETAAQRFHQIVQLIDLEKNNFTPAPDAVAIVGFVCDEGIKRNHGRPGAAEGPTTIRQALAKMPLPYPELVIYDVGDILCLDNDLENSQKALAEVVGRIISSGARPLVLGGGHEQAWGNYQGLKQAEQHTDIEFVNIDAHYDIRPLIDNTYGSSGTSFYQIAKDRKKENLPFHYTCVGIQECGNTAELKAEAQQMDIRTIYAEEFFKGHANEVLQKLMANLEHAKTIHLSICMDVFAAAYAPGVSAPQALGITPWDVIPLIQALTKSGKIKSMEIAEVSPPHDHDGMTSRLAANLIYYLVAKFPTHSKEA